MKAQGWWLLSISAVIFAAVSLPSAGKTAGISEGEDITAEEAAIALGRRLFYEGDLSRDGSMACSTCHVQRRAFADGQISHPGVTDEPGHRNVPGLANIGMRKTLTWADPTMHSLEKQALTPLFGEHPVEMGMAGLEGELVRRLQANLCYAKLFQRAYPEEGGGVSVAAVTKALAAFQRSIVSNDTAYDAFLRGDANALTPGQKEGLSVFKQSCASCHSGPDLTDDKFYAVDAMAYNANDRGVAEITGKRSDNGKFRTPSLRHVTLTAPYFHDGRSPDIPSAIRRHKAVEMNDRDIAKIVEFLGSTEVSETMMRENLSFPKATCELH